MCCINGLPLYHSRSSVSGAKQPCIPTLRQVPESRWTIGLERTYKVLPDACAPLQPWHTLWLFLHDQQSHHTALPFGRHYPRRFAIPKGWIVHPRWHGTSPYSCQPSSDLLWDMPTGARSNGSQKDLLVLNWQLSSENSQSSEKFEVWQLRENYSGRTSDQEVIRLQNVPCKWWHKKQLCQLLRVWSGQQAASSLERTKMAVLVVDGKAHKRVSSNGKVSWKLILILTCYIYQADFTHSIFYLKF